MNRTLSTPQVRVCQLPQTTSFSKDDVLYKIIDGKLCKFLVLAVTGECKVKLRAFQTNDSGQLSNHTFEIHNGELDFYQLDASHTKLRKAFFDLVRQNTDEQSSA